MLIPVRNLGQIGIVTDIAGNKLPANAWTAGKNVRCRNMAIEKTVGYSNLYSAPAVIPYSAFYTPNFWVYCGQNKVYATDGITHSNITRQTAGADVDYSMDLTTGWTGGVLNGVLVLNNGTDLPQMWSPQTAGTKLTALANWPTNATCKVMRPFKNFLVAMNVQVGGVEYPQMVYWSHPADPGAVPLSWDETNPARDAGKFDLADTPGHIVDSRPLGDMNIIYKTDATYAQQLTGNFNIFRFPKLFDSGIMGTNCVKEIFKQHLIFSHEDVILHNGQSPKSLIDNKNRRWLFNQIDSTNYAHSFIGINYRDSEAWICFPTKGAKYPNLALVWNWADNTFTPRDIPNISDMVQGANLTGSVIDTWDSAVGTWETDTTPWSTASVNPLSRISMMVSPTDNKLYELGGSESFNGTPFIAYLERTGLALAGVNKFGEPYSDERPIKQMLELYPHIEADPGTLIEVYVGAQLNLTDSVQWVGPFYFNPEVDEKVNITLSGRLFAVKFQTITETRWWRVYGYDINIVHRGRY